MIHSFSCLFIAKMSFQHLENVNESIRVQYLIDLGLNSYKIKLCYNLDLENKLKKNIKSLINRIEFLNNRIINLSNREYSMYGNKMYKTLSRLILQFNSINDKIIF